MTMIPMRDLKNTVEIERRCAASGAPIDNEFLADKTVRKLSVMRF